MWSIDFFSFWGKIRDYVSIALLAGILITSLGWYITNARLTAAKSEVTTQKSLRKKDRAQYQAAQKEAEARAYQQKQRIERENNERAKKADQDYNDLLSKYNAALVRYRSAQRSASRSDLPRSSDSSESGDRPSESSELFENSEPVIIPFEDAKICAENTARLEAVRDWAIGIKEVK